MESDSKDIPWNEIIKKEAVGIPTAYFVSRCTVAFLSLEQYFLSSRRSGLLRLFFFEI